MLKPKKKVTQKEIKRDPFLETVDKIQAHYESKRSFYLKIIIIICIVFVGLNFFQRKKNINEQKSSIALGIALISIEEKDYDNAEFQLGRLLDDYPNSNNAFLASYYLGKINFDKQLFNASKKHLIDFYDNVKDDLLKPSAAVMLSKIYSENKEYDNGLKWIQKAEKLKINDYYKNMITIEKANLLFRLGKKQDSIDLLSILLAKDNLSNRQKELAQQLFSLSKS